MENTLYMKRKGTHQIDWRIQRLRNIHPRRHGAAHAQHLGISSFHTNRKVHCPQTDTHIHTRNQTNLTLVNSQPYVPCPYPIHTLAIYLYMYSQYAAQFSFSLLSLSLSLSLSAFQISIYILARKKLGIFFLFFVSDCSCESNFSKHCPSVCLFFESWVLEIVFPEKAWVATVAEFFERVAVSPVFYDLACSGLKPPKLKAMPLSS